MKIIKILTIALLCISISKISSAQEIVITSNVTGCNKEIKKYCKDVTKSGADRISACLYAHEDHLSKKCQYSLYDAAAQLQHEITKLSYVASECMNDLDKLCANVEIGDGRLLNCLDEHNKKVSKDCKSALKQTGFR
ncbi:MAG: hypothetical protein ACJAZX_000863 [Rickettsiales bacterium]|jgi:hypothetical protein